LIRTPSIGYHRAVPHPERDSSKLGCEAREAKAGMRVRGNHYLIAGAVWAGCVASVRADITEEQVLVVYNSAAAEGTALKDSYLAAHPGIPPANVLDLNNPALLTADVSYAQFAADIRTPIRDYLAAPGFPEPGHIIAMALIRPFPHRVLDTDNALVGDTPTQAGNELSAGDATFASVDAELVLLWQDLDAGEAGGPMDSHADNVIDNPYHTRATPVDFFPRNAITTQKRFSNRGGIAWEFDGTGTQLLQPGDLYLVCRIDGNTLADAQGLIDRARDLDVDRPAVRVLLDEFDVSGGGDLDDIPLFTTRGPFYAGDDYEETRDLLVAAGWDVRYDGTADFITGAEEPSLLIAYASYGENHGINGESPPGNGTYIEDFNFAPGAIFNTLESYNGRGLNGLGTLFNQEQVADFVASGGTFGIGMVFEPFAFSVPDNEFLLVNMLVGRMRWAEAAYTSLPALSWQYVVIGDPLGRYNLPGDCDGDDDADLVDFTAFQACFEALPLPDECACADLDGDLMVTPDDYLLWFDQITGP